MCLPVFGVHVSAVKTLVWFLYLCLPQVVPGTAYWLPGGLKKGFRGIFYRVRTTR